ncbi:MAG: 16S rRNA (uracil(1498)-N(3))-methyltransferase [Pirellulales bacterium]|nr:16S rRNA (uracil(1498)-N(3))-methyltransferase [Pirellulales bacterium]
MLDRFYSETPLAGDLATLAGAEAHHLAGVLRAAPGDELVVFDGRGGEYLARVAGVRRDRVELLLVERRDIEREAVRSLTLAVALPKGERQRWLVEKVVELGVARLVPLITQRGVAQPTAEALARLRRAVIEASKQCGRNRLMEIAEPRRLGEFAAPGEVGWIAHPSAERRVRELVGSLSPAQTVAVAIGPEGGFAAEEFEQARAVGAIPVGLGERILRVETAALAVAAVILS